MKAIDLRFSMETYLVTVVMPDTFSSTFSIAHNVAVWSADELGEAGNIGNVLCSMAPALFSDGYYTLAVTFDWPPPPEMAIKALGIACARLGCSHMSVSDPLNYGVRVQQAKPYYVTNDIMSAALKQIRDNTSEFFQMASQGENLYKLSCNSLYS